MNSGLRLYWGGRAAVHDQRTPPEPVGADGRLGAPGDQRWGAVRVRGRAWGFAQVYRSPGALGLISLHGIVVAPRPNRAWRVPAEHRR
jgi:hypothetical protein